VLLSLAVVTLMAFWPVLHGDFINYDDDAYVTADPHVQGGLTWTAVRWALTTGYAGNWFPVTWLSHAADVSLFGLDPRGHHATNLALHVVNALLLCLLFRSLTGELWRSAGAAALFALHPAHVESVAWVSERKDLLCAAFWLGAMWAYGFWARRRGAGRYALVLLLFMAGLMSKPMIVTLPLVLLLLDYWPLGRASEKRFFRLVVEKAPLFLMAAASSLVTFFVQRAGGAVRSLETFPLWTRLGNAALAYVHYLRMLFWPAKLAIFYPHPGASLSAGAVLGATLLLLALSAAAVALRRKAPFLFVGWFWFLITLLPVIGIVQVGRQAMADRYTYIPFIGPFVALVWGLAAVASRWRYGPLAMRFVSAAVVLALALATAAQARVWKTSETVFSHARKVTRNNSVADNYLGQYFNRAGKPTEAIPYLSEAARIDPSDPDIRNNLGVSAFLLGRWDEAARNFSEALRLAPRSAISLNNLARTRFLQGEIPEAIRLYEDSLAAAPDSTEIHQRLALALLMEGKTGEALEHSRRAVALGARDRGIVEFLNGVSAYVKNPTDPSLEPFRRMLADADLKAGAALYGRGKKAEGTARVREALGLSPSFAEAHNELGTQLVNEGRLEEAETEFVLASKIDPGLASAHNNLGYVLFLRGRIAAAIEQYGEALRLQPEFPLARSNLDRALRERGEEIKTGNSPHQVSPSR
jgi:Flp pilus assembly protein TadD